MREIKFRVWDRETQEMLYYDIIADCMPGDWQDFYILQQYTGLKDSEGIEIYEGDIVHFAVYNANGIVEWDNRYYGYQVNLIVRPPEKRQSGSLFDFVTSIGWCDSYEVIGNIYENPELLKEG